MILNSFQEFRLKAHLARHLATAHGLVVRSGSPRPVMKTRAAFCLITTPLTRISRRLCKDILNPRRAARSPFIPVNIAAIKQECRCSIQCVASMYGNPTLIHKQENCMINTRTSLLQCILCSIYFIAVVF